MQGVGSSSGKVLVLAATNTPHALDQAVRRRFDKRIYIPLPDDAARAHIFRVHVGETPNNLTDEDYQSLGVATEGFSGSDIDHAVKDVLYEPAQGARGDALRHRQRPTARPSRRRRPHEHRVLRSVFTGRTRGVALILEERCQARIRVARPPAADCSQRFRKVLLRARPTVAAADLEIHERFTREFGEEG